MFGRCSGKAQRNSARDRGEDLPERRHPGVVALLAPLASLVAFRIGRLQPPMLPLRATGY